MSENDQRERERERERERKRERERERGRNFHILWRTTIFFLMRPCKYLAFLGGMSKKNSCTHER